MPEPNNDAGRTEANSQPDGERLSVLDRVLRGIGAALVFGSVAFAIGSHTLSQRLRDLAPPMPAGQTQATRPAPPSPAEVKPPSPGLGGLLGGGIGTGIGGIIGSRPKPEPTEEPRIGEKLDQALAALATGHVAFEPARKMWLGETEDVEAVLGIETAPSELAELVRRQVSQVIEVAELKVSDVMVAELDGGAAFKVDPVGDVQQPVSHSQPTRWRWKVTPLSEGSQELTLIFSAIVEINGKERQRRLEPVFDRPIRIEVGWGGRLEQTVGVLKQFKELWLILASIAGGIALWSARGRALIKRLLGR